MKMVEGYVKVINENNTFEEKECKIINFFSWSDGTKIFPIALIMMERGEILQCPASSVRFKLNSESKRVLQ